MTWLALPALLVSLVQVAGSLASQDSAVPKSQLHTPLAQESRQDKDKAARRLDFMKESVASYAIYPAKDRKKKLTLFTEPQLRWDNPVGGAEDGTFFLWTDQGRPEVAIQVFLLTNGLWLHEFSSLSARSFVAELEGQPCWTPANAGVEFKVVPDAPSPAETPQVRLRQMKTLTKEFSASDEFEGKSWWELRLLPRPLLRYGNAETDLIDGALFAFVHGTDPEVLLLLEARATKKGQEWQYALAPMTAYAVKVSWKRQMVWSLPWRRSELQKPTDTFYLRRYSRE